MLILTKKILHLILFHFSLGSRVNRRSNELPTARGFGRKPMPSRSPLPHSLLPMYLRDVHLSISTSPKSRFARTDHHRRPLPTTRALPKLCPLGTDGQCHQTDLSASGRCGHLLSTDPCLGPRPSRRDSHSVSC